MVTQATMTVYRKRLASLWFLGAAVPVVLLLIQTFGGHYGRELGTAWGWILPTVMPSLSLILGDLVIRVKTGTVDDSGGDKFVYRLAFGLSLAYLILVTVTILAQPFVSSSAEPTHLMSQSNLWLGPFQGLVCASLGAFFVKGERPAS